MGNIVAIVGRPNVGKSTLFNRLVQNRQAIEEETSGVTRDRHYGRSNWNGVDFSVIDTGGYVVGSDDIFESEIARQVDLAIHEADVILFMVDVKEGITPLDQDVTNLLRKYEKKKYLVANKVDNHGMIADASEFYSLGFDNMYTVSAINGSGTGELLDDLVTNLEKGFTEEVIDLPKIAFVGRPNVGKSSLLNALLDENRNIVTDIPGTTRDSIYTPYNRFGFNFMLVDTAGIRKKGKVHENIEFYSVMRSIRVIESSDVCLLLVDATQGFEAQDLNIVHLVKKNHKGLVVLVNKWDLIEKDTHTTKIFEEEIKNKLAPFRDVPILFTSVTGKQRIIKALETAGQVYENKSRKIPTSKLNDIMLQEISNNPPPAVKGKYVKIKYVTQIKAGFPVFAFFCNLPQYVKDPYKRFLENKIREHFDFTGVPIEVFIRKK